MHAYTHHACDWGRGGSNTCPNRRVYLPSPYDMLISDTGSPVRSALRTSKPKDRQLLMRW